MNILTVDNAEHGMKLISFLAARLENGPTPGELHRWIRTGQVRVNGKRAKAFDRVAAGDAVRLPPFAAGDARHAAREIPVAAGDILGGALRVLAAPPSLLALEKPSGLPSQPGTGHRTDAASILRDHFAGAAHIPAPAHRLDKLTSGILMAGRTHEAQEKLHALFARQTANGMEKTYLAWVGGAWPYAAEQTLTDYLVKEASRNPAGDLAGRANHGVPTSRAASGAAFERMRATGKDAGKEARCRVSFLEARETACGPASLLRVVLETGRTHQIRVQLAIRNFPIIGDVKYGGKPFCRMLLHAYSLAFDWGGEHVMLAVRPDWPEPFAVALSTFGA